MFIKLEILTQKGHNSYRIELGKDRIVSIVTYSTFSFICNYPECLDTDTDQENPWS